MVEPTSTTAASVSLTVLLVGLLGPTAGPWAAILAGALGGSLWPLSGMETPSSGAALFLVVRCVVTSLVLTGIIAAYIERTYGTPISESLAVVSLVISAMGNGWRPVIARIARMAGGEAK